MVRIRARVKFNDWVVISVSVGYFRVRASVKVMFRLFLCLRVKYRG
jgi:hypothetical protein